MNFSKLSTLLTLAILLSIVSPAFADDEKQLTGQVSDPVVEAQEKLMHAKGSYRTVKQQEDAIRDMKRATRLSLRAAKLRAKAERLQTKADMLVNKANKEALTHGLYITNPLSPVMMQPPQAPQQESQTAKAPSIVPVPGQPINIIIPKQEEVSLKEDEASDTLPEPPPVNF